MLQHDQLFQSRYRIDREVGRGSFGAVYLAEDIEQHEPRAIKLLLPEFRGDVSLRHRLQREARLTASFNNPHVVRIYDLQETEEGDLYLVMEFLDGEELAQTLQRQGRLPLQQATDYAIQILDVLAEAHALGVVHRDLKPHNVFICHRDGQPDLIKVFDFGIAKVTGTDDGSGLRETTKLTVQGGVMGTPTYMSPEQCRGEDLTPASDIYSLSVLLY